MTNNTAKKIDLIQKLLKIIFNDRPTSHLYQENPGKVSFTVKLDKTEFETRFEMFWNRDLDFEIWEVRKRKCKVFHVKPSLWYRIADLLKRNYMDTERLRQWD